MGLEPIDPDNTGEEAHAVSVSILFDVLRRNTTYRHRFFISIGVAIGQAITGASAVLYYSKNILYAADVQSSGAAEAGIAIAKLIGALFTIVYVDRIGRRKLLLSGTAIMIMCHIIFALLFWSTPLDAYDTQVKHQDKVLSPVQRILVVFFLHLFILAWNISWAPLMWIICSEVLPNEVGLTAARLVVNLTPSLVATINRNGNNLCLIVAVQCTRQSNVIITLCNLRYEAIIHLNRTLSYLCRNLGYFYLLLVHVVCGLAFRW